MNNEVDNNSLNGSPKTNSKSKGSPNDEKNKQLYRNLLAQQCLGTDIFTMENQFENLSDPSLALKTNNLDNLLNNKMINGQTESNNRGNVP